MTNIDHKLRISSGGKACVIFCSRFAAKIRPTTPVKVIPIVCRLPEEVEVALVNISRASNARESPASLDDLETTADLEVVGVSSIIAQPEFCDEKVEATLSKQSNLDTM